MMTAEVGAGMMTVVAVAPLDAAAAPTAVTATDAAEDAATLGLRSACVEPPLSHPVVC